MCRLIFALYFSIFLFPAYGGVVTWDGGGDGSSWTDALNWDGDTEPQATDDVVIDVAANPTITLSASRTIQSLNCQENLTITSGTLTLTQGTTVLAGDFTLNNNTRITADGATSTVTVSGNTNIDNANISALNGAVVNLTNLISYTQNVGGLRTFLAEGLNSQIALPALTTLTPRNASNTGLRFFANAGGTIDLPLLNLTGDGALLFQADGQASQINIPALNSFDGRIFFADSGFKALNGGNIHIPNLTSLTDANFQIDSTSSMQTAQITEFLNDGVIEVNQALAFTNLTTINGVKLKIDGALPSFPSLSNIDDASVQVFGGQALSLPLVTSYSHTKSSNTRLEADGVGSTLNFPNLTNIIPRTGSNQDVFINALNAGNIHFPELTAVGNGSATFKADGAFSLINLPKLASFDGYLFFTDSGFRAINGGTLNTPALLTINDGNIQIDATSTMPISQIQSITGNGSIQVSQALSFTALTTFQSKLLLSDAIPLFPALSNIDNSSILVSNGLTFSLPLVLSYTHDLNTDSEFQASGSGSILTFPNLTTITGRSASNRDFFVDALDGGRINLPSLSTVIDGAVRFKADGTNSYIDLPLLQSFNGYLFFTDSGFYALNGGTLNTPILETIQDGRINIDTSSSMIVSEITTFTGGGSIIAPGRIFTDLTTLNRITLTVNSTTPNFPSLSNIDNSAIIVSGGNTISLPLVTSYTHNVNADITFEATGIGSLISLPNLTNLFPHTGAADDLFINAFDGGVISFPLLSTSHRGAATFRSRDTGSVIELPSLTSFEGNFFITDSGFRAIDGGLIEFPTSGTTQISVANIEATNTGSITGSILNLADTVNVSGDSTIAANIESNATITPTGILTIDGNFSQFTNGSLNFDISGAGLASTYQKLVVNGFALLDGAINVNSTNYTPAPLEALPIIDYTSSSGAFASTVITLPNLGDDLAWEANFEPTALTLNSLITRGPWIIGEGDGLNATYFNDETLTTPVLNRIDPAINFNWVRESPAPSINIDSFSVRWTGQLLAPFSQDFTFHALTDDGVRVWLDINQSGTFETNELIIEDWTSRPVTQNDSAPISLVGGQLYDIKIEYYEDRLDAVARLLWSSSSITQSAIPSTQFYSNPPNLTPPPSITPAPFTYQQSVDITLTSPHEIRYTTDGSTPRPFSPLYTGPITVTEDTFLQARAFSSSADPSGILHATYFIEQELPDLRVTNIVAPSSITPGDLVTLNWTVENIGLGPFSGNRVDSFYLSTDGTFDSSDTRAVSFAVSDTIAPSTSQTYSRTYLATEETPNGDLTLIAVTDDNLNQPESDETNNSLAAATLTNIPVLLSLSTNANLVNEGASFDLRFSRNGDISIPLTVTLGSSIPSELNLPPSVTIPAGSWSIDITASVVDDSINDGDQTISITASAAGFSNSTVDITTRDNDLPSLSISATSTTLNEGESTTITVTRSPITSTDLTVNLITQNPSVFDSFPSSLVIPANTPSASVTLTTLQNTQITGDLSVQLACNTNTHTSDSIIIDILDDDIPSLTLSTSQTSVSESPEQNTLTFEVSRSPASAAPLTLQLTNTLASSFSGPSTLTIPAYSESVSATLEVIDNAISDGNRIAILQARLPGNTATSNTLDVTILDDELPSLTLSLSQDFVAEGESITGTISRAPVTNTALLITLATSDPLQVTTTPTTVTIPANTASTSFSLDGITDSTSEGSITYTLSATAVGHNTAELPFIVSDELLSDLIVESITLPTDGEGDEVFQYGYTLNNVGTKNQTTPFLVRSWLSRDEIIDEGDFMLGQTLETTLLTNTPLSRTASARAPNQAGGFYLLIEIDADDAAEELVETNNITVSENTITLSGDYNVTVSTDTDVAYIGSAITFTGTATGNDALPAANSPVNILLTIDGNTTTLEAITDTSGNYSIIWESNSAPSGTYSVTASHPASLPPPEQDSFDLTRIILQDTNLGIALEEDAPAITQTITLRNASDIPVTVDTNIVDVETGVTASLNTPSLTIPARTESNFELSLSALSSAPRDDLFTINYLIEGEVIASTQVQLAIGGPGGRLIFEPKFVTMATVRGTQSLHQFSIKNVGATETGDLQVVMPNSDYISLASPSTIPSMNPGESRSITLQQFPQTDTPLGASNGNFIVTNESNTISFGFESIVLADTEGALQVNLTDELSFWDAENNYPSPANVTVTVINPYTNATVATSTTDLFGSVIFDTLPEGYYEIEASPPEHLPSKQTVYVASDILTQVSVFLRRSVVSYNFSVTPTEIEDRYSITVTTEFQTNVPLPVITVEPAVIDFDELLETEQDTIIFKITNHGLVGAQNVEMSLNLPDGWSFTRPGGEEFDFTIGDIPAASLKFLNLNITRPNPEATPVVESAHGVPIPDTEVFPPLIDLDALVCDNTAAQILFDITNHGLTPISAASLAFNAPAGWVFTPNGDTNFDILPSATIQVPFSISRVPVCQRPSGRLDHYLDCGGRLRRYSTPLTMIGRCLGSVCPSPRVIVGGGGDGGGILPTISPRIRRFSVSSCNECLLEAAQECLSNFNAPPNAQALYSAANWSTGSYSATDGILQVLTAARGMRPGASATGLIDCKDRILDCVLAGGGASPILQTLVDDVTRYADHAQAIKNYYNEILGSPDWLSQEPDIAFDAFTEAFADAITETSENGSILSAAEIIALESMNVPTNVTAADISTFLARWNRSVDYWALGYRNASDVPTGQNTDFIEPVVVEQHSESVLAALDSATEDGHENPYEGFRSSVGLLFSFLSSGEGVCATVKLEIEQEAVLTQTGFNAKLEIANNGMTDVTNVNLDLVIRHETTGEISNALFDISEPVLEGLTTLSGSIPGETVGSLEYLLRPKRSAAESTISQYYSVGGQLSYTIDGSNIAIDLIEETIEVIPQPLLRLKYFQQRDVYSDDPFTTPIEPSIPYSLGLMVENIGFGTARNLNIISSQPQIVDNDKGLLVDFQILGSQVDGQEFQQGLEADFGDLLSNEISVANWDLVSSLHGHFISFDATFEHLTGTGAEGLSAIEEVTIHEMIQRVSDPRDNADDIPDYITNDLPDPADAPDKIHLSTGEVAPLINVSTATAGTPNSSNLSVPLTFSAPNGHMYLTIPEPSDGNLRLASIVRSDGRIIPVGRNAWITDRIFLGLGLSPIYENRLHLYDHNSTGSYTLNYTIQTSNPNIETVFGPCPIGTVGNGDTCLSYDNSPSSFEVTWADLDDGLPANFVAIFNVYVSENGGAYVPWIESTNQTSALYEGAPNSEYRFYAVATGADGSVATSPYELVYMTTTANNPPVIDPIANQTINENELFLFTPTATDPDNTGAIRWSLAAGTPIGISINQDTGQLRWQTGDIHGGGTISLTVIASDGSAPFASTSQTFSITVNDSNDAPSLTNTFYEIAEKSALSEQIQGIDRDIPLQTLTYTFAAGYTPPSGMNLSSSGLLTWTTPDLEETTDYIIPIVITDDETPAEMTAANLRIRVRNISAPPLVTLVSNPIEYTENLGVVPVDSIARVSDPDSVNFDGGSLTINLIGASDEYETLSIASGLQPGGQTVGVNGNMIQVETQVIATISGQNANTIVFSLTNEATPLRVATLLRALRYENPSDTPAANPRSVNIVLNDGDFGISPIATRTINVIPENDAPVVTDDKVTTIVNTSIYLSHLLENDSDIEGSVLRIDSVSTPTQGTATLVGNIVTYTPSNNFTGTASFTYDAADAENLSTTATVTVEVVPATSFKIQPEVTILPNGNFSIQALNIPNTNFEIWSSDDLNIWEMLEIISPNASGTIDWFYTPDPQEDRKMFQIRFP